MTALLAANRLRFLARSGSLRIAAVVYATALGVGTLTLLPVPFVDTVASSATPALDVAWWLWALLTPWWVSRLLSVERGDTLAVLAAQAAAAPEQAVLAQAIAALAYAGGLALLSLPIGVIAYLSGRAEPADVLAGAAELFVLVCLSIAITLHCSIRGENRIATWTAATIATLAAALGFEPLVAAAGRSGATAILAAATVGLGLLLPVRARRELMYATDV